MHCPYHFILLPLPSTAEHLSVISWISRVMEWIKIFSDSATARQVLTAGRPQLILIQSTRICLVLQDDRILAIEDKCSHNGESLSKGKVNYLGEIICPWHGYRFNLKTGRESGERSRDLSTYPVREDDEGVFLGV